LFYPRFSVFDRRAGQFQKVVVDLDHAGKLVWSFVTMGTGKSRSQNYFAKEQHQP
jgi:hypothetical protein